DGATVHQLPLNAPPNAIHGTARDAAWRTARAGDGEAVLTHDLAEPWPYPGRVTQQIELAPDSLTLTMSVETYESSFPAQIGWHPWFLRNLGGADAVLDFAPAWQEERGDDHLPTGRRVDPRPGPWDDCFGMPGGVDVTLTWPGQLRLTVTSREEWVVIYDEQREAVCVEPQTGPPDGLNTAPRLVTPLEPLEASTTWTWARLSAGCHDGHARRAAAADPGRGRGARQGDALLPAVGRLLPPPAPRHPRRRGRAAGRPGAARPDRGAGVRRGGRPDHGRRPGGVRDAARRRRARADAGRLRRPQGRQGARPAAPRRGPGHRGPP